MGFFIRRLADCSRREQFRRAEACLLPCLSLFGAGGEPLPYEYIRCAAVLDPVTSFHRPMRLQEGVGYVADKLLHDGRHDLSVYCFLGHQHGFCRL